MIYYKEGRVMIPTYIAKVMATILSVTGKEATLLYLKT